ncbi:pheromone-processing carboxypeptidase KEX1-like [Punica granatum]|nr:pheromone-processing carboxypeptidase KEX1-like [Punica granatum]
MLDPEVAAHVSDIIEIEEGLENLTLSLSEESEGVDVEDGGEGLGDNDDSERVANDWLGDDGEDRAGDGANDDNDEGATNSDDGVDCDDEDGKWKVGAYDVDDEDVESEDDKDHETRS